MLRVVLISFLLGITAVEAQESPATHAMDAADRLREAQVLLEQAESSSDRVKALTETIRAYESGLEAMRESLRQATLREATLRRGFEVEADRLSRLLGVLMTIEASSGVQQMLHPEGPLAALRAGMIVSDMTPELVAEAKILHRDLEEVATLRALQENAAATLETALQDVQEARTRLSQAISDRTDLPRRYLDDPDAMSQLIAGSETLDAFAGGLASSNIESDDTSIRNFSDARGDLRLPVSGTLLRSFNEADAAGIRRPGLLISTRPGAVVVAPWAATLRYAGPLLDYGNVVILEPQFDTLLILAGMRAVFGTAGEVIPAGTAVGLMGGTQQDANTFLQDARNGAGSGQSETLYIELRLGGGPVDAKNWFEETRDD
ncbi:MAG: peptidoglycan DD-metalloendopeptidase family protein [Paracoccaceae bacterium]|nr:peptidoglycan DD-metalloendopeptidase family protein [Paracoccaceae bacterium]